MARTNKFVHFNTREAFDSELERLGITDPSASDGNDFYHYTVFIKDTGEIYTHGKFYQGDYSEIKNDVDSIKQNTYYFEITDMSGIISSEEYEKIKQAKIVCLYATGQEIFLTCKIDYSVLNFDGVVYCGTTAMIDEPYVHSVQALDIRLNSEDGKYHYTIIDELPQFKSINGQSIIGEGNIETDIIVNSVDELASLTPILGTKATVMKSLEGCDNINFKSFLNGEFTPPEEVYSNLTDLKITINSVDTNVIFPECTDGSNSLMLPNFLQGVVYLDIKHDNSSIYLILHNNFGTATALYSGSSWHQHLIDQLDHYSWNLYELSTWVSSLSESEYSVFLLFAESLYVNLEYLTEYDDYIYTSKGWVDRNLADSTSLTLLAMQLSTQLNEKQDSISDLATIRDGASKGATAVQPSALSEEVAKLESAIAKKADSADIPSVPTKVSDLTNDSGFQTASQVNTAIEQALDDKADKSEIPTKVSELTNDSGYQTASQVQGAVAGKQDAIQDLATIRSGAAKGSTAVQPGDLATVATSGSYSDLSNKPTIPSAQVNADWNATSGMAQILNKPTIPAAVTSSTVSGWGFTKNTGTYSKPSGGIPKSDLASSVQTSLSKADTALQTHQDISGKQDVISDLATIRSGAAKGATAVQPADIANFANKATYTSKSGTTSATIQPNTFTDFGSVTRLSITLGTVASNASLEERMFGFQFTSGSTATTLTLPSSVKFPEDPTIEKNHTYQVTILNNLALIVGWPN